MKKILLGLMALSAVSFAEVQTIGEYRGDDTKVKIRNTDRVGRNRTETMIDNNKLGEKTYMDIEITNDHYHGDSATDKGDIQVEIFHQLGDSGRFELYTDLRGFYKGNGQDSMHLDVMPTMYFKRDDKGYSLLRAGLGYGALEGDGNLRQKNEIRYVAEFKNVFTINERLELEGNLYYTGKDTGDGTYNNQVIVEAYAYFNQPIHTFDNGVKVDFLAEAGIDPYSFGERATGGKDSHEVQERDTYEDNYFYGQATVRATVPVKGDTSVWTEVGYYAEEVSGNSTDNSDDDGAFVQFGVQTKF